VEIIGESTEVSGWQVPGTSSKPPGEPPGISLPDIASLRENPVFGA